MRERSGELWDALRVSNCRGERFDVATDKFGFPSVEAWIRDLLEVNWAWYCAEVRDEELTKDLMLELSDQRLVLRKTAENAGLTVGDNLRRAITQHLRTGKLPLEIRDPGDGCRRSAS